MSVRADSPLVIVVEDDDDIRQLLRYRLEHEDLRVLAVRSGAEAVALAADHSPDLLLLDVGLPDGDGYEVCRRVLEASESPPAVIFLTARITTADRVTGLDAGAVDYVAKPFDSAELVARVHAALRTKRRTDDLARQATVDSLTGMLNRTTLDDRLVEHVALARRGQPLGCAMVDIDHFKLLNDRHGHAAGDQVLREVARRIRSAVRVSDLVFRYGGEEFLVLLPGTDLAGAEVVGRNLMLSVSSTPVRLDSAIVPVAVSVGIAAWQPTMAGAGELAAAADEALYRAKRLGRAQLALGS